MIISTISALAWKICCQTTRQLSSLPERVFNGAITFTRNDQIQQDCKEKLQSIHEQENQGLLTQQKHDKELITWFEKGCISFGELLETFKKQNGRIGNINLISIFTEFSRINKESKALKQKIGLMLQAIHEKESEFLFTQQEQDIKLMSCFLQQGDFSGYGFGDEFIEDKLHKIVQTFKTRPDGACKIILELAMRSGIMEFMGLVCHMDRIDSKILSRDLLQTAEFMIQKYPDQMVNSIDRYAVIHGLECVIKDCSEDMLLRVFSQAPLLLDYWKNPNQSSLYCLLKPDLILKYAMDENKLELFQYMLKTLTEIKEKFIISTEQYNEMLLWAIDKNYVKIIKKLMEAGDNHYLKMENLLLKIKSPHRIND